MRYLLASLLILCASSVQAQTGFDRWYADNYPPAVRSDDSATWVPLQRALYTQSLVIVNDRHTINAIPRSKLERKWQVSGGCDKLAGFKSAIYKREGTWHYRWPAVVDVFNGSNNQDGIGWVREYADGSAFKDELTNTATGKVFEVRIAERVNGHWRRFVDFSDPEQRPSGYVPIRVTQCHACHAEAGKAAYGAGSVPGGGGVFSEPVHETVEAGRSTDHGYAPIGGLRR